MKGVSYRLDSSSLYLSETGSISIHGKQAYDKEVIKVNILQIRL